LDPEVVEFVARKVAIITGALIALLTLLDQLSKLLSTHIEKRRDRRSKKFDRKFLIVPTAEEIIKYSNRTKRSEDGDIVTAHSRTRSLKAWQEERRNLKQEGRILTLALLFLIFFASVAVIFISSAMKLARLFQ